MFQTGCFDNVTQFRTLQSHKTLYRHLIKNLVCSSSSVCRVFFSSPVANINPLECKGNYSVTAK